VQEQCYYVNGSVDMWRRGVRMWESGVTIQEVADLKRSAKCVGPGNFD